MEAPTMTNTSLWDKLGKTDPSQTKGFKRGGGFTGTAVKPIYTEQKMTETFGPVGIGWGFSEPKFQLVPGENKELLVYCWLTLWYVHEGVRSGDIPGVGGDKVIGYIKPNEQYNRPERWENDDEAFKKAFTDAIGNAMKHLGMSADVHMGLFDDSKYVREMQEEFAEPARTPSKAPAKPTEAPKTFVQHLSSITSATDEDSLKQAWLAINADRLNISVGDMANLELAKNAKKAALIAPGNNFDDIANGKVT
jgi:hypothetical protein